MLEVSTEYREPIGDQGGFPGERQTKRPDAEFSFTPSEDGYGPDNKSATVEDEAAAMMAAFTRPLGETDGNEDLAGEATALNCLADVGSDGAPDLDGYTPVKWEPKTIFGRLMQAAGLDLKAGHYIGPDGREVMVLFDDSDSSAEPQASPVYEARHRAGRQGPETDPGAATHDAEENQDASVEPGDGRSAGGGGMGPVDGPPIPPVGSGEPGGPGEEWDPAQVEREARRRRVLEAVVGDNADSTRATDVIIDLVDSSIDACVDKHVVATGEGPGTFADARSSLEKLRRLSSADTATIRSGIIALCSPAIDPRTGQEIAGSRILEAARLRLLDTSRQDATLARVMGQPRFRGAQGYAESAVSGWSDSRSATVDAVQEIISAYNDLRRVATDPQRLRVYRESISAVVDRIDRAEEYVRRAIERSGRARTHARRATMTFGPPSDRNAARVREPDFSRPAHEWRPE